MSTDYNTFNTENIKVNPQQAIRNHCRYNCCAGDMDSWKNCSVTNCWLHPFRLGKNPYRQKRELSDEAKEKQRLALQKARESKSPC